MDKHYSGHRERLRARFKSDPALVADYELLELLLGHVLLRKDTKPLAKELLQRFQSLKGVLDAKPAELLSVEGFGPGVLAFWGLLRELMARYAESPLRQRECLATSEVVANMARTRLAGAVEEETWIAFVDSQLRLLVWERLSRGSISNSPVYPSVVAKRALAVNAHGFIMVHNHPGGNPAPSRADLKVTDLVYAAAKAVEVHFLDHIIVSDNAWTSLRLDNLSPAFA